MKKLLTILTLLMVYVSSYAVDNTIERIIWSGSEAISYNTEAFSGSQYEIGKDKFTGLADGNTIRIYYTPIENQTPKYKVIYRDGWTWNTLYDDDAENDADKNKGNITISDGVISYTVQEGVAEKIKNSSEGGGMVFSGIYYTITKVSYIRTASCDFTNLNVGDKIKVTFSKSTEEGASPSLTIKLSDDTEVFSGNPSENESYEFEVTSSNIETIVSNGLILQEKDLTVSTLDVTDRGRSYTATDLTSKLKAGESRVLYENSDGLKISWNRIGNDIHDILEENEEICVTVKEKASVDYPRVTISSGWDGIKEQYLTDITAFPYDAVFSLSESITKETTTKSLKKWITDGFYVYGDGYTVTKVVLTKPLIDCFTGYTDASTHSMTVNTWSGLTSTSDVYGTSAAALNIKTSTTSKIKVLVQFTDGWNYDYTDTEATDNPRSIILDATKTISNIYIQNAGTSNDPITITFSDISFAESGTITPNMSIPLTLSDNKVEGLSYTGCNSLYVAQNGTKPISMIVTYADGVVAYKASNAGTRNLKLDDSKTINAIEVINPESGTISNIYLFNSTDDREDALSSPESGASTVLFSRSDTYSMSEGNQISFKNSQYGSLLSEGQELYFSLSSTGDSRTLTLYDASDSPVETWNLSDLNASMIRLYINSTIHEKLANGFSFKGTGITEVWGVELAMPATQTAPTAGNSLELYNKSEASTVNWWEACYVNSAYGAILAADDEIKITVTKGDSDGSVGLIEVNTHTAIGDEVSITTEGEQVVTFSLTDALIEQMRSGFSVWGKGYVKVTKVELYKPEVVADPNLLWSGTETLSTTALAIAGTNFSNVAVGNRIFMTFSTGGTMVATYGTSNTELFNGSVSNEYASEFEITSDNIETIKASGITITGATAVLTKIERSETAYSADGLSLATAGTYGWGSSYDTSTKTITFNGTYQAYGWNIGNTDYNEVDNITFLMAETPTKTNENDNNVSVSLYVDYVNKYGKKETLSNSTVSGLSIILPIKNNTSLTNGITRVRSIYLKTNVASTVKLANVGTRSAKNLSTGTQKISAHSAIGIAHGLFENASVGDVLTLQVSNIADGAKYSLKGHGEDTHNNWTSFVYDQSLASNETTITRTLTSEDLAIIQDAGLSIEGSGFTCGDVTLTTLGELGDAQTHTTATYTLTITSENGSVTVKKDGTATDDRTFDVDTELTLTAKADEGYTFSKWTDGENELTKESDGSLKVTMSENKTVVAEFESSTSSNNVLWEGSQAISWTAVNMKGESNADKFESLTADSKIRISLTNTNTEYTSLQIWYKDATSNEDIELTEYAANKTTYDFVVTSDILASIKNGIYIKGDETITLTKIEKVTDAGESFTPGDGETVLNYTQAVMEAGWTKSLYVGPSKFQSANTGDILKIYLANVSSGGISLSVGENPLSDDSKSGKSLEDGATSYSLSLTATDITALKAGTLRITGQGFTVIGVTLKAGEVADPNTLWEDTQAISWTETHLTGEGFSSLTAGTVLRVTLTNTNTDYTSLQIWAKDSEGANDTQVTEYSATKTVYEFYVTEGLLSKVKNGLYIKGDATITLTKIEKVTDALVSFTPGEGETVIDYTQAVMQDGWAKSLMVGASNFQSANAGDILTVYLSGVSSGTISLSSNNAGLSDASSSGKSLEDAATTYTLTLTESDVTALKAKELRITGQGFTITGVTLKAGEAADPNVLWEGTQAISWTESHLTGDGFSSLTAGTVLRVTLTNTNTDYTSLQIWVKDSEGSNDTQVTEYSATKTVYEFYVTESLLSKVKNGLYIKGDATITLTKIEKVTDALVSFTPGEGETVIDYTQAVMQDGWAKSLMVGTSNFQSANAGDVLTVYLSNVSSGTISLSSNNAGLSDASNSGKALENEATTYTLTLTESDVTALKANELRITGQGFTVTGVTLKAGDSTSTIFDSDGKADLSKFAPSGDDLYNNTTYIQTVSKAWEGGIGLTIPASENISAKYLVVKFAEATAVKVMTGYSDNSTAPNVIMNSNATEVKLALDVTKVLTQVVIQGITDGQTVKLSEVSISNKCTLTVSAANGTVAVKNGETATTDTEFDYGTALTLTATPAGSDYSFKQWVIGETTKTDNPYTFTITGDTEITAEFKSADEDVIWLGSQEINWNTGTSQTIAVTKENNLKIDDQLVFSITPAVEGIEWPQLQLSSKSDGTPVLIGTANTSIDKNTTEVKYYVTKAMLNDITENGGFIVSGAVFELTKVRIERGNGGEGYENAIWIGEKEYPSNWSVYTTIGKDLFANATVGQVIRMKYKDVKTGSSMSFSYDNDGWVALPDAASVTPSGLATKLTITEDMLTALKAGGLIISGINFTLTSVELLDASAIKTLTGTVPVTGDDWVWTSSETPSFTVNVTNENNEAVTAEAVMLIKTDKLADVKTLTENKEIAANGSGTITFTYKPESAGFYNATVILNDETVRSFNFGYAPTEIVSAADKQSDFDSYWAAAKSQLAAVEASDTPVLTEMTDKSTSKRKVYLVEFKSIPDGTSGDPVTVRGYYCEPTDGVKHPVLMHYQGYDSFTYGPGGTAPDVYCPSGDDNPDYAEFVLSTRGQALNNREPYKSNGGNPYGQDGWFKANFGDKDSYYYRGAYMDVVRAIDFMATRETSDMDNLFAEGQSQGGAFTYAAAALSGRTFKAIAPAITFMGDFPDYFELASWPGNEAKEMQAKLGWTDEQLYAFMSYYDTKNLATKVSCPVITSIGVQDNVCPPHTNIAPYNNVTTGSSDKQVIFNAELQHATNSEWNTVMMKFFDKYNTWEDPNAKKLEVEEKRTLWTGSENLGTEWPAVASQSATVGGILEEGEKFLITVSAIEKDATDIQVTVRSADYEHTLGFSKFDDFDSYPAEVKLILSADDVEAFKNGFHITGKNCTVTKLVLYKPTPVNRTERTLLEKKQAVGDGVEINRGLFSNAVEEDVLKVYFEVADGATAKINLEDMDYNGIENSWPVITTSPYTYTFTATALKKIQDSGMRIRGENFTFLKATLYTEKALGEAITDGGDDDNEDDISNANASENTKKVYNVLKDLYGKKIVSGVVANIDWNTTEAENVYEWTGKYPAMNVFDYINLHASKDVNSEGWLDYSDITPAKNWWQAGGIVGAMWHWQMKANNGTDYTCTPGTAADETSFDASKVYVDGTSENTLAKQQLDQLCGYFAKMQEAGIPVVWRPLHEGSGNVEQYTGGTAWFWWGVKGADVYKKLWQWMYNYMVTTKGLNNLIWVWTSQTGDDNWYPGDAYVDIIGRDNYGATAAKLATEYEELKETYPNKMITLAECGNSDDAEMATISSIWDEGSRWSWFMTWYDNDYNEGTTTTHKHTSKTWWTNAVAKDYVVTRDQMKELLGQDDSGDETTGVNISLDNLNEGWSSTYDATTKTITTTGEWAARGWYIGDDRYSSKGSITVKYEAVQFGVTLKMEYTNSNGESKSVSAGAAAGETEVELDIPSDVKTIEKVYITYQPIGTLKLTAATVNDKVVDNRTEKTLVEAEAKIADGDIKINRGLFSNAVAKDVIRIYATGLSDASKIALEPGDYSGAIDGANWTSFTESPFELKLTESVLATIKEKGLLVRGESFTFTKAVLYTESDLGSEISDGGGDDSGDDSGDSGNSSDSSSSTTTTDETVFDQKDGEADLTKFAAQDEKTTTVTYDKKEGTLTITTTEDYKAAQIWFNTPEEVTGNVLEVEIAEAGVNVTITVGYTDGSESVMSSVVNAARAVAMTRGGSGTKIVVPLDEGKEIQKIEVKNAKAGTITINSMTMTTQNVFTNYKANLSMMKPQSGATYDVSTYTLATTKGWTGVTLTPLESETVKGAELLIRFQGEATVKVAVKYRTDEDGPSTIMEQADASVRLALNPQKEIQEITVQPTTASVLTFAEMAVYPEKGMGGLLSEGEPLEVWSGNESLSWNEIARQGKNIGAELQEYDEILVTISSKAAGNDWPKVFLRDANYEMVGTEILLNEVETFPYVARFVLTKALVEKLKNGFAICGDGVTVTKVEVYRPYPPKKGDIHLRALDYGYGSEYDVATNTITTTQRWAARGWEIGDSRYNNKDLVLVQFEAVGFPVTLKMEYVDAYGQKQATSAGVAAGNTEVRLAIPSGIKQMDRAYIIYQNPGSLTLTNAEVITALQASSRGISEDSRGIRISGGNSFRPDGNSFRPDGSRSTDDDAWYTLGGQRIEKPTGKGVYIHNGKTVVVHE